MATIYAIRLQAELVTLSNDYIDVLWAGTVDCVSSADAEAQCAAIDAGTENYTAVFKYVVTKTGSGLYGDVVKYSPLQFKKSIEPNLVLTPPTGNGNVDGGTAE